MPMTSRAEAETWTGRRAAARRPMREKIRANRAMSASSAKPAPDSTIPRRVSGALQEQQKIEPVKGAQETGDGPASAGAREQQNFDGEVGERQGGGGFYKSRRRLPGRAGHDQRRCHLTGEKHAAEGYQLRRLRAARTRLARNRTCTKSPSGAHYARAKFRDRNFSGRGWAKTQGGFWKREIEKGLIARCRR